MQRICYPLQNECQGLQPEIIRLITVVHKYSISYLIFTSTLILFTFRADEK